jgi:hypothetical protein
MFMAHLRAVASEVRRIRAQQEMLRARLERKGLPLRGRAND